MLTYTLLPQKLGGHLPGLRSFISFSVEERVISGPLVVLEKLFLFKLYFLNYLMKI